MTAEWNCTKTTACHNDYENGDGDDDKTEQHGNDNDGGGEGECVHATAWRASWSVANHDTT
jgi:hypothetical protein